MNIIADNLSIHYERMGKGLSIVIIPGWADTSLSWRALQIDLAQQYDVVVIDLPGFGGSELPAYEWNLDDFARLIKAVLQKLQIKPYAVIGHSNGGAIALRGIAQGVLVTHKLILAASAGIRRQAQGRKQLLKVIAKSGKVLSSPLPMNIKRLLREKLYTGIGSDFLVAEHMQGTFKKIVNDDTQADAGRITIPTLLIYGHNDTDTPVTFGKTYQQLIPRARLEILPETGHFLQLEKAIDTSVLIRKFLDD